MGKKLINTVLLIVACMLTVSCGKVNSSNEKQSEIEADNERKTVVGFSQLGAESDWRNTHTQSMIDAFSEDEGYELIVENAQQKQANQITAIRKFIQIGVDYIILAPVTEHGWDTVLGEAKEAGIPVIIVDRMIDVEDESLYVCWVGSDFMLEGRKAVKWLEKYCELQEIAHDEIHIVNIQGTIGSTSQIYRSKALEEGVSENGWELLEAVEGDFTRAKGREAMESLLLRHDNINVVYCENDNEALGAIEAIEEAGLVVGSDIKAGEIMIISFDGVNEKALSYAREGKITCIAQCNPLHGMRVKAIIDLLETGGTPDKQSYVAEKLFSSYKDIKQISIGDYVYEVELPKEVSE